MITSSVCSVYLTVEAPTNIETVLMWAGPAATERPYLLVIVQHRAFPLSAVLFFQALSVAISGLSLVSIFSSRLSSHAIGFVVWLFPVCPDITAVLRVAVPCLPRHHCCPACCCSLSAPTSLLSCVLLFPVCPTSVSHVLLFPVCPTSVSHVLLLPVFPDITAVSRVAVPCLP